VTKTVDAKTMWTRDSFSRWPQIIQVRKWKKSPLLRKAIEKDIPILHQQIQIQFTPGSDEIMPGSYLLLDKLGETMTSFARHYFAN